MLKWLLTRKNEMAMCVIAAVFIVGSIFLLWITSLQLPDLGSFENRLISQSTKIYDRTGSVLLYDINQGIRRTVVKSSEISVNIKNAAVAIEDVEFYQHRGIKFTAILRAVFANLASGGYTQGGSTITQQVIKNALLTSNKSIARKLKEWILALKLERVMTKDEILTTYLNDAPYGGNIYGVEGAAMGFFGKHASEVTLAEAAYLSALPNAPTYYSPYGKNKKELEKRKNLVLEQMLKNSFVSKEDYDAAKKEEVKFSPQENLGLKAPHFVMYIKKQLEEKYGEDVMNSGGYRVITTLDYKLEQKAEEIVKKYAASNAIVYNASNAALIAIGAQNGDILVMVGSRDYFDPKIDGNFNIVTAYRQPGSALKPFVYAAAFQKGYTPETVVFDVKTEFSSECKPDGAPIAPENEDKCYMPENYDGKYRGPISLRNALAQSVNVPAIKILYLAGIRDSIYLANSMGIESLNDPDRYGLTLVLGGGEVSPLELTGAYAVFANDGVKVSPHGILRIENPEGNIIYSYAPEPKIVLDSNIARKISDILNDNEARTPLFGADSPLLFRGYDVAVKTGTTNDYRDAWIMGYTKEVAVGAWAGNNDNSPMEKKVAGFIVAPMWNAFMQELLKTMPIEHFKKPNENSDPYPIKPALRGIWYGGDSYFIDARTGNLADQTTPDEHKKEVVIPNVHEILYWVDKNNPLGPKPDHPENDPQYLLWEEPAQKWAAGNYTPSFSPLPAFTSSSMSLKPTPAEPLKVSFVAPQQQIYLATNKITMEISASGSNRIISADYYINGEFISSVTKAPFSLSFVPREVSVIQKYNNIKVVAYDSANNRAEAMATFVVNF